MHVDLRWKFIEDAIGELHEVGIEVIDSNVDKNKFLKWSDKTWEDDDWGGYFLDDLFYRINKQEEIPQSPKSDAEEYEEYMSNKWRREDEYCGWSKSVYKAAKAIYKRERSINSDLKKWKELDLDAIDHYCTMANLAITAYLKVQLEKAEA